MSFLSQDDKFVKNYFIPEVKTHSKGYTIYKIVCQEILKADTEPQNEVTIWKRYNDFKKLHKSLKTLHQSFYLKGHFPKFARAKLFGRFDENVIVERKASILKLLWFINERPVLASSPVFASFFEDGVRDNLRRASSPVISDAVMKPISADPYQDRAETCSADRVQDSEHGLLLGGVWNYRKPADDISFNSDEISDDDHTTFTDSDSMLSTPQPAPSEFSFFDPILDGSSHVSSDKSVAEDLSSLSLSRQTSENSVFNFPDVLNGVIRVEGRSGSLKDSDLKEFDPLSKTDDVDSGVNSSQPMSPLTPTVGGISSDIQQYLFDAASLISLAQQHEVNNDYERAFHYYKMGIDKLLSGVQQENNPLRRDAVRKKISHYLQRADQIHSKHIAVDPVKDKIWTDINLPSNTLNSPLHELSIYKVLGVIGKVTLVLDTTNQTTYVMKTMYKSSSSSVNSDPSIVPTHIPYMTRLYKVYNTDYAIFLLLEHASGGRLWGYVSQFIQTSPCSPSKELQCPTRKLISPAKNNTSSQNNVYSGRQFISSEAATEQKNDLLCASIDDDLHADNEYPKSYLQLFTDKGAECSEDEPDMGKKNSESSVESQKSEPTAEPVVLETQQPTKETGNACEADDLISNARKLLSNVGQTIEKSRSEVVIPDNFNDNINTATDTKVSKPRSLSLVSPIQKSLSRLSDPFCSPVDSPVRKRNYSSSIGGSLENLSTSHARGASAIFKQLDEINEMAVVYLPEKCVKLWAAEIVIAVSNLHIMGIICKDLKPDNILLGEGGHIKLSYFSQWNCVTRQIDNEALENLYCAPEVDGVQTVTRAADWWSVGVLLYELLTGRTLSSCHPGGITSHTQLFLPNHLSQEAKLILSQLLTVNPVERLGSSMNGFEDMKSHPFFRNVDWLVLKSS